MSFVKNIKKMLVAVYRTLSSKWKDSYNHIISIMAQWTHVMVTIQYFVTDFKANQSTIFVIWIYVASDGTTINIYNNLQYVQNI